VGLAWPVLVWLTPASSRPWISGTSDNSIWSLILGYNGFGRLDGQTGGPAGGGPGGGGRNGFIGGSPSPVRLLNQAARATPRRRRDRDRRPARQPRTADLAAADSRPGRGPRGGRARERQPREVAQRRARDRARRALDRARELVVPDARPCDQRHLPVRRPGDD